MEKIMFPTENRSITLNNGVQMPQLGLGVWLAKNGQETYNEVRWALEAGYRSIDTAELYDNEESVGKAIRDSGLDRGEVFLTTKVWNTSFGYEKTLASFQKSLELLQTEYVDLYLLHYPVAGLYLDSWRALEELYQQKKVRAIGVSNFHLNHLVDLMEHAQVQPVVNQIELHPYLTQKEQIAFCGDHHIAVEAWSPIAQGTCLKEPVLLHIAQKYGKSTAQVVLRWELQQGIIIIPKSVHQNRIVENAQIFDFSLTDEEMTAIDGLNKNGRIGPEPNSWSVEKQCFLGFDD